MKNGLILILSVLSVVLLSACGEKSDVPVQQEANAVQQEAVANAVQPQDNAESSGVQIAGADLFTIACQACHSMAPDAANRVGPNLYGIVGEAAASRAEYTYSEALKASGLIWNKGNLTAWIVASESMAPGTWMAYHNVLAPDEVPRLVEYIEQAASPNQP